MIVIIDYHMGNLRSVQKAFQRLNTEAIVTDNEQTIRKADKLVLPGVGHFAHGMNKLKELNLIEPLNYKVNQEKKPILGICLGMQLFSKYSEEGNAEGLGWIDAETIKFTGIANKIPHMGWNNLIKHKNSAVLKNINETDSFYFVHSYHVLCSRQEDVLAKTLYGVEFTSAIEKDNIFGMQFHPEKSHKSGLEIIKQFILI